MELEFSKDKKTAEKHLKKVLNILSCQGNAIKSTLRFHLIPVRLKTNKTKHKTKPQMSLDTGEAVGKGEHLFTAVGKCRLVQPLSKSVWRFPTKLKQIYFQIQLYSKDFISYSINTVSMFIAAFSVVTNQWKQPRYPSTGEWMMQMLYIYIGKCKMNL